MLVGYGQVTQPGKPIDLGIMLAAGGIKGPVEVYAQRLGAPSPLVHDVKKPSEPVLVATFDDVTGTGTSISLKDVGTYNVYAKFDGGVAADGNYYRPSQSGIMEVKVTNSPVPPKMHKPSLVFLSASSNDPTNSAHQIASVGDTLSLWGQLRCWSPTYTSEQMAGKILLVYCQYKKSDSDAWGSPVLVGTSAMVLGGGYGVQYAPKDPGCYRFQAKFAGDTSLDPSTSNYVDVLVKVNSAATSTLTVTQVYKADGSRDTGYFTGELTTTDGQAITGATVTLWRYNADHTGLVKIGTAMTEWTGSYTIYDETQSPHTTYYYYATFDGSSAYSSARSSELMETPL